MEIKELFKDIEKLDKYSFRLHTIAGQQAIENLKWILVNAINDLQEKL